MSFMVIAVAMLTAFILQFLFQMVQMRSFNKYYTRLRKMGINGGRYGVDPIVR